MTSQEFHRLLAYSKARHNFPRFHGNTKRKLKCAGTRPQGRALIPLEKVFLKGEYKH